MAIADTPDLDLDRLPAFADLPIDPAAPADSNWGLFGAADDLGCLNFLTPRRIVEAAGLVRKGRVFRLELPINGLADPPLFRRNLVQHTIINWPNSAAHDDKLDDYNTQEGAQWDGFGHAGIRESGLHYNGVPDAEIRSGPGGKLGIHRWANKMVGRAVLLDLYRYRQTQGRQVDVFVERYTVEDLDGAARAQGVEFKPGDILLLRTGWLQHYLHHTSAEERQAMADMSQLRSGGLEASREMAAWLWNHRFAALAADNTSVEAFPMNAAAGTLHLRALVLLGLPLGEQFNLEELAVDCAADGVFECMLISVPIYVLGGIASPANTLAIK